MEKEIDLVYEMTVDPPAAAMDLETLVNEKYHIIVTGRSAIKLPRWKWWSRAHIKADWERYRRAVAFKRREKHWDWVGERRRNQ